MGAAAVAAIAAVTAVLGSTTSAQAPPKSPGTELSVDAQVPADTYLIGNVAAINTPPTGGFVSVFGGAFDGTSTVNTTGSDVLPNAFIADPGTDGSIGVRIGGSSPRHVVIDSVAELAKNPNTMIFPSPRRIKDTRETGPAVTAGGTIPVEVGAEYAGDFALINLTVDRNDGRGFQATFPCSEGYQGTSSINVKGDGGAQAILNLVKVDDNGEICIRTQRAAAGTIVDFLGVITSDAEPFERIADTRNDGSGPLQAGDERGFVVGEPNSVFIGTIVSTNPSARGWVAAYTNAGGFTGTSTLNSDGANSVANLLIMRTDPNGRIYVTSKPDPVGLRTDLVIDGTTIPELAPHLRADSTRLRDTRDDAAPAPPSPPAPPANPGDTRNCSDFATYAGAKAWFDTYFPFYGDVARLDADGNGIPCESLPGAP